MTGHQQLASLRDSYTQKNGSKISNDHRNSETNPVRVIKIDLCRVNIIKEPAFIHRRLQWNFPLKPNQNGNLIEKQSSGGREPGPPVFFWVSGNK